MNRRYFIRSTAAASVIAGSGLRARANSAPSWKSEFRAALEQKPWLLGFLGTEVPHFDTHTAAIDGRLPDALRGTLYRNGPARHEIGDYRYHHWFDGDGMVQAYRFTDAGVSHRGRMIGTSKYMAESLAGRPLYPGFGSIPDNTRPVTGPDSVNVANISMLQHGGKLLALWEAGSPHEIDPDTLDTRGVHSYSPQMRGVPFSAHPRVEPDGTLWNFGYVSGASLIVLWHIDPQGKLVKVGKVPVNPISMPHDFVVTDRHIVILNPPLYYEADAATDFLSAHVWHPERPTQVLVIDKNDFDNHFTCELPAQWVFHFGNAWEDETGVIRFDGARANSPMVMLTSFRDVMRGLDVHDDSPARHHNYRIDTRTRTASEEALLPVGLASEFPNIDPRISTRRHHRVVVLTSQQGRRAPHPMLDAVTVLDVDDGAQDTYRYPDTQIPEEHLFVPAVGSAPESNGFILGTFLDWRAQRTGINVFDATNVASGPIVTATLDYAVPLGLHGKFVST